MAGITKKRLAKIKEKSDGLVESGEQVQEAVYGITGPFNPATALGGFAVLFGIAKPRIIAGTNEHVYVMQGSMASVTGIKKVLDKYPVKKVKIELDGIRLQVEDHELVINAWFAEGAKRLVTLARAGNLPAPPEPKRAMPVRTSRSNDIRRRSWPVLRERPPA